MTGDRPGVEPAVVAGVDASDAASVVVEYAVAEAELHALPLRLVHVVALFGGDDLTAPPALPDQRSLLSLRHRTRRAAGSSSRRTGTTFALHHGSPIGELTAVAPPGSLLVLGADRHDGVRPRGVVAEAVAARATCPVVVIPRTHATGPPTGRVVVGFKHEWDSGAALAAGFRTAARRGLPLLVLHAADPPAAGVRGAVDSGRCLDDLVALHQARWPTVSASSRATRGRVVDVVRATVSPADLLVLGRSSAWCTHPVLGPVDRDLLHLPPCPVAVVPPASAAEFPARMSYHLDRSELEPVPAKEAQP
jgi:nucleotide-binding universal stress UspA family protein